MALGIPVPLGFDQEHVMYVWFDALTNYLSGVHALVRCCRVVVFSWNLYLECCCLCARASATYNLFKDATGCQRCLLCCSQKDALAGRVSMALFLPDCIPCLFLCLVQRRQRGASHAAAGDCRPFVTRVSTYVILMINLLASLRHEQKTAASLLPPVYAVSFVRRCQDALRLRDTRISPSLTFVYTPKPSSFRAVPLFEKDAGDPLAPFWPAALHVIGKDITWFHCVIWPCILKSAGLALPATVYAHGFVAASDGRKMSKSLGNVIDPHAVCDEYVEEGEHIVRLFGEGGGWREEGVLNFFVLF